ELRVRHLVRAARPRRHRGGLPQGLRPARRPLARGAAERRRRLGGNARLLRGRRVGRTRRVHTEPDRVGAPRPLRGGARRRPRHREGHALSHRQPESRWHLGRSPVERHGLPAGLLFEVPPLREVLPALGPGRVSERFRVTDGAPAPHALPLPARWIGALGYLTLYVVESLGRFGRFLGGAAGLVFVPPPTLGRLAPPLHFTGLHPLTRVILPAAF